MADGTYGPKFYRQAGGDRAVVASGGSLDVESGGEIDIESGGALKIAGTALTTTAAEVNKLAGVVAGTVTASKAVVVGTNKEVDVLAVADLKLGAGAGTSVTATAAEINKLDGAPLAATFVIGAEAGNVRNVAIQLKDGNGADIGAKGHVFAYLSDDADGSGLCAVAPDGNVGIGTDGLAVALVADKAWMLSSEADGDIDLNVGETGAKTYYLHVLLPNGLRASSGAIAFT